MRRSPDRFRATSPRRKMRLMHQRIDASTEIGRNSAEERSHQQPRINQAEQIVGLHILSNHTKERASLKMVSPEEAYDAWQLLRNK